MCYDGRIVMPLVDIAGGDAVMNKLAQNVTFYLFVGLLVYGFLTSTWWLRVVCIVLGVVLAVLWIGWDWFISVIRYGRTYRG